MSRRAEQGYTYLALLFVIALVGAGLGAVGIFWHTAQIRAKERELLYIGDQYRKAIERYYKEGKTYPRELRQLIRDQRTPDVRRYLRKLYPDPVTNKNEWGLVKTPDGGIAGIFSLSEQTPFKTAQFPVAYADFEGRTKYSDWKFVYMPQGAPGVPGAPGASGASQQRAPGSATAPGGTQPGAAASRGGAGGPTGQQTGSPTTSPQSSGSGLGIFQQSTTSGDSAGGAQQQSSPTTTGFASQQQGGQAPSLFDSPQQNAPPVPGSGLPQQSNQPPSLLAPQQQNAPSMGTQ